MRDYIVVHLASYVAIAIVIQNQTIAIVYLFIVLSIVLSIVLL